MCKKQALIDLLFLTILGAFFFCVFAGSYHLISPDEGRYIEVAREMVASGNFITPHLDGTVFLDKPALFYWIESFLIMVFGLHEWSVRLLPAFFALMGCWFTYWAGHALYNRRTGLLSALILMTMLLYFMASHYTNMDLMVAVLISSTLWVFLIAVQLPQGIKRSVYLWLAYALAAAAFLTKGLMGIVFPCMIIGVWIVLLNRWRLLKSMNLVTGLILFFILILPWMVAVQLANPEFLNYFFVVQQFSRYLTPDFNMHQPIYYYAVIILGGILPWTIFFFQACAYFIRQMKQHWQQADKEFFIFLWPLLIFIFFSIPESKVPGYILPVFPPIAMIIGRYLAVKWDSLRDSRQLKICSWVFLLLAIIASFALIYTASLNSISTSASFAYLSLVALVIMIGGVLVVGFTLYHKHFKTIFITLVFTTIVANVIGVAGIWSFKLDNTKQLALHLKAMVKPGNKVITFYKYYQDLPVYLQHRVYVVSNWQSSAIVKDDDWRRELDEGVLYKHYQQPLLIDHQQLATMWTQQARLFVITSARKESLLRRFIHYPIYRLYQYNGEVIFSNQPGNN